MAPAALVARAAAVLAAAALVPLVAGCAPRSAAPLAELPVDGVTAPAAGAPAAVDADRTPEPPLQADAGGYLPLPRNVEARVEALDHSPHARLLVRLQQEIDARDAPALAARVPDAGQGLALGRMQAAGPALHARRPEVERYLAALFRQGSRPRLQGYATAGDRAGPVPCLDVVVAEWLGRVRFPTPEIGAPGEPVPAELPPGAGVWTLCGADADGWRWRSWSWEGADGDYAATVRRLAADGAVYAVLRPAGSDVSGP